MMFCIGTTMKFGLDMGAKYGYTKVLILNFILCSLSVFGSSYTQNLLGTIHLNKFLSPSIRWHLGLWLA